MPKLLLLFLLAMASATWAINMEARGLEYSEYWGNFYMLRVDTDTESFYGYSQTTTTCEYRLKETTYDRPSNQAFEVIIRFQLPDEAMVVGAAVREGNTWVEAKPLNVFTAEDLYDSTHTSTVSLLLRDKVRREYWGEEEHFIEMRLAPVYYPKPFAFRLTYIDRNEVDVGSYRYNFSEREFVQYQDESTNKITWRFRDADVPSSKPTILNRGRSDFVQSNGWWQISFSPRDLASTEILRWPRSFLQTPELRLLTAGDESFYHYIMLPPLNPEDRLTKKVLLLYDLGNNAVNSRIFLMEQLQECARLGLADTDSITVLYIDNGLLITTMNDGFVAATDANVKQVFDRVKSLAPPEISGLPQLLRAAKDFFNEHDTYGEVWVLSDANKNCDTATSANQIMALSLYRMKTQVKISIFDCSDPYAYGTSRLSINGRSYYGNQYLYENLSRLSGGGVLYAYNLWAPNVLRALADVFMPAVDIVETDLFPTNGLVFGRYKLNYERTHFPILYPFQEIGRHDGAAPFNIDFYGEVDEALFHKTKTQSQPVESAWNEKLKILWYNLKIRDMLRQPQSWQTIEDIGALSEEMGILSPYCGFVVPAPDGYAGFMRLLTVEENTVVDEIGENVIVPQQLELTAFPNPFNATTQVEIKFNPVSIHQKANLRIVDILGRLVKTIDLDIAPGDNRLTLRWDGRDESGATLPSGVYLVFFQLGDQSKNLKLTLMK